MGRATWKRLVVPACFFVFLAFGLHSMVAQANPGSRTPDSGIRLAQEAYPVGAFLPLVAAAEICPNINLVANPSFEDNSAWVIPATAYSAQYSTYRANTGARSALTGIPSTAANVCSFSDIRQTITIPTGSTSALLTFFHYGITSESPLKPLLPPTVFLGTKMPLKPLTPEWCFGFGDTQYFTVLDTNGTKIAPNLWYARQNDNGFVPQTVDLTPYVGKTIQVDFGTYNDGYDGFTSMYVDDVSVTYCTPNAYP